MGENKRCFIQTGFVGEDYLKRETCVNPSRPGLQEGLDCQITASGSEDIFIASELPVEGGSLEVFAAKCIGKGAGADLLLLKKDVVRTLADGGVWGGVERKAVSFGLQGGSWLS